MNQIESYDSCLMEVYFYRFFLSVITWKCDITKKLLFILFEIVNFFYVQDWMMNIALFTFGKLDTLKSSFRKKKKCFDFSKPQLNKKKHKK